MSQRPAGYSQNDMIALWMAFVVKQFAKTGYKTTFRNKTRSVFRDRSKGHLVVLDEYHGHLELIALQKSPGPGKHLGVQEIEVVIEADPQKKRDKIKQIKLGKVHSGEKHAFVLTGKL